MSAQARLEYVSCNLCGSSDTRLLYKAFSTRYNQPEQFNLVKCNGCGLVYTNPRIKPEFIARYYPGHYKYHEQRMISFCERLYYMYHRNPKTKKGKVLDVGCGNGSYLYFLKNRGWDCYGTEINEALINFIKSKLNLKKIFKCQLYEIDLPGNYFDLITFWGSLEHIDDPFKTLTKAHELLKPCGKIIIWIPNIESLEAKLFKKFWHHLEIPTHYYQFSPETICHLLRKIGYKIYRIRFDAVSLGLFPSLGYSLNKFGLKINMNLLPIKILSIPIDMLSSFFKISGLMTIYATK